MGIEIDDTVVMRFIKGDIDAFKTVYEKTKSMIFKTIFRMVGNTHDAEDLTHDVYVRIYEKRKLYKKEKAALSTWIYQVAINHTLNGIKYKKNTEQIYFEERIEDDFLDKAIKKEEMQKMITLLQSLKAVFRICIILKDIEERSYTEISKILNISTGTLKSRLNRGRSQLGELLKKYEARGQNEL